MYNVISYYMILCYTILTYVISYQASRGWTPGAQEGEGRALSGLGVSGVLPPNAENFPAKII